MEALLIMFAPLFRKLLGSKNDRDVKRMYKMVNTVNAFEEQMVALSDEQLQAKTDTLRERLAGGESLNKLLPEAFAWCAKPVSASWACATLMYS